MNTSKKTRLSSTTPSVPDVKAAASEAEKNLGEFCRAASHELGNALGTVLGELDYGLLSQDPAALTRAMSVALGAVTRAISLARNLRYFALHPTIEPQLIDVSQLILDTVELVEKDLKVQRVKVTVLVEAARLVNADPAALQQVFLNLLSRAAETMPQGGKLTITMRQANHLLEICCADSGVGIPAARLPYAFEPSVDRTETRPLDTQSLSLSVVKALMQAQAGEIRIESNSERGTTFVLSLPYDPRVSGPQHKNELRRFRRVSTTLPVEVSFQGKAPFLSELTTLSMRGCFILVPEQQLARLPRVESIGELRIHYYQDQVLDITKCRIANHSQSATGTGIGIEFLELDIKTRTLLEAIVKSHSFE